MTNTAIRSGLDLSYVEANTRPQDDLFAHVSEQLDVTWPRLLKSTEQVMLSTSVADKRMGELPGGVRMAGAMGTAIMSLAIVSTLRTPAS